MKLVIEEKNLPNFKDVMKTVSSIVDEAVIELTNKGLEICQTDRASVSLITLLIDKKFFKEYEADGNQLGMNMTVFNKTLERFTGELTLNDIENAKLHFEEQGEELKRELTIPLYDIQKTETPAVELKFDMEGIITTDILKKMLDDALMVGDSIYFEVSPEGLNVRGGTGITKEGEFDAKLKEGKIFKFLKPQKKVVASRFCIEYVQKFINKPITDIVKIFLADSYPLKMQQIGNKIDFGIIIAPRVEEGGSSEE